MAKPLTIKDIPFFKPLKLYYLLLDLVEVVVLLIKRVKQTLDVTRRMKNLPWMRTSSRFACLQHQDQGIQAGEEVV
jgi:hypothetical protein